VKAEVFRGRQRPSREEEKSTRLCEVSEIEVIEVTECVIRVE